MNRLDIRFIVVKKVQLHSTKKAYEGGESPLNRGFTTTKVKFHSIKKVYKDDESFLNRNFYNYQG